MDSVDWNDGMDWTGTVEWNGMEYGKQQSIKVHAHMVPSFIIIVFGLLCCIIRILSRGRWAQGIGALLCPGHKLIAGYFTPLGNTAIKC